MSAAVGEAQERGGRQGGCRRDGALTAGQQRAARQEPASQLARDQQGKAKHDTRLLTQSQGNEIIGQLQMQLRELKASVKSRNSALLQQEHALKTSDEALKAAQVEVARCVAAVVPTIWSRRTRLREEAGRASTDVASSRNTIAQLQSDIETRNKTLKENASGRTRNSSAQLLMQRSD